MPIDVEAARALTPGCARVVHLNHAGASLAPTPVLDAVIAHLRLEAEVGGYEVALLANDQRERFYGAAAELLGCAPGEVAYAENATRAWDLAVYGLAATFRPGDRILTGRAEYGANVIACLHIARQRGLEIEVVPDDDHGQLSVAALGETLEDERVRLVAVTHVPTQGGLVNPAEAIGGLTRSAGVPFLLVACQSLGQRRVDVEAIGCDLLSASGRKFLRGPRGTGLLYVRASMLDRFEPAFIDLFAADWVTDDRYELRPDARRFECFERSVAGQIGLGVAIDHAVGWGIDAIEARVVALAEGLRSRLAAIPGVVVHDQGEQLSAIVTFTVEAVAPLAVAEHLHDHAVNVSVARLGSARFDLGARRLPELVRASVHYVTTDAELDRTAELVAGVAGAASA